MCANILNAYIAFVANALPLFAFFLVGLTRHELCHTNELKKSFKCDECESCFETSFRLKAHKKTHVPIADRPKPFPCTLCDLRFESERRLRGHLYNHKKSKERDAKCEFCDKAYPHRSTLKEHLMVFHKLGEAEARASAGMKTKFIPLILPGQEIAQPQVRALKPGLSCSICSKKYSRRDYVTSHLMGAHGKTAEEAKKITGFETKREIPARTSSNRTGRKKTKVIEITSEYDPGSSSSHSDSDANVTSRPSQPHAPGTSASTSVYTFDMSHPFVTSVPIPIPPTSQAMGQWSVTNTYPFGFLP